MVTYLGICTIFSACSTRGLVTVRILATNYSMPKKIKIDVLFCTRVTAVLVLQMAGSGLLLHRFELDRERH